MNMKNWHTLDKFNKKITENIMERLPSNAPFSKDDVSGQVNSTFISLIHNYKDNPNGMSLTSYIWQYAEKYTIRDLLREYRRLCNEVEMSEIMCNEDDKDGVVRHKYGEWNQEPKYTIAQMIENDDFVETLRQAASRGDS